MVLKFADKKIALPKRVKETLEFLATGRRTSLGEIQDQLDSEARLKIVRLLLKEGFLTRQ